MNRHQRRSFLKKLNKKAFIPAAVHEKLTQSDSDPYIKELISSLISTKNPEQFAKKLYNQLVEDTAQEIKESYTAEISEESFEDED